MVDCNHCSGTFSSKTVCCLCSDGRLIIIAADSRGSVAAFDIDGKELWERHLGSLVSQVRSVSQSTYARRQLILEIFWLQQYSPLKIPAYDSVTFCLLQAPSFADVNGDGYLEILTSSVSGAVYVMDRHGRDLRNFPFYTQVSFSSYTL